jgi:hypothetical protein
VSFEVLTVKAHPRRRAASRDAVRLGVASFTTGHQGPRHGTLIGLGVLVLLVLFFVAAYNGLVNLRNRVRNAWAQIDVQLTRRHDLIPNLVETVKGYASHERETFRPSPRPARPRPAPTPVLAVHPATPAEAEIRWHDGSTARIALTALTGAGWPTTA